MPYKVLCTPYGHHKRRLGNWQSDNAYDLSVPDSSKVYSIVTGKVLKVKFKDNGGVIYGWQITIQAKNGMMLFYTHLKEKVVKTGDFIQKGQLLGMIGRPTNREWTPHLHIALKSHDLLKYMKKCC